MHFLFQSSNEHVLGSSGYTLVKTSNEEDMEKLKARCEKQLRDNPQRPSAKENAGLSEDNAYWVRNDVVEQPFPEVVSVQNYDPGYTEEEYKTCDWWRLLQALNSLDIDIRVSSSKLEAAVERAKRISCHQQQRIGMAKETAKHG